MSNHTNKVKLSTLNKWSIGVLLKQSKIEDIANRKAKVA